MKRIKIETKLSKNENDVCEYSNNLSQGITKRLLEKYKPKGFYNIETISNKIDRKVVA